MKRPENRPQFEQVYTELSNLAMASELPVVDKRGPARDANNGLYALTTSVTYEN